MAAILEGIFKGFAQWLYGLGLEIVQYIANSLLNVFTMDLSFFRRVAPVTDDILSIILAAGWALLLGNMVFQATKSMATGLGFEGEDPKLLFTRTFVFGFLLLASQQICEIGLGISNHIITLLQIPSSVTVTLPDENCFDIGASWLLVIIVGIVIMWQVVKLFFEIAERYVVTALLVILSPLAFAMGGSKNTADIFKGWCRMFGSMCAMMVLNVIFLKLLISAMGYMPSGVAVLPWMLLIVGIARTARKADSIIARMGLNPAITGDGLGRGLPGMVAYAVIRSVGSTVTKTMRHSAGKNNISGGKNAGGPAYGGRSTPPSPPPPGGAGNGQSASPPSGGGQSGTAGSGTHRAAAAHTRQDAGSTSPGGIGTAGTGASSSAGTRPVQGGQQSTGQQQPPQRPAPGSGAQARPAAQRGARRSSVRPGPRAGMQAGQNPSGGAGSTSAPAAETAGGVHEQQEAPQRPPIPRVRLRTQSLTGQASGSGRPETGESRKSSVVHTTSETVIGSVSAAHSNTQTNTQQTRAAKSIRQDGTPKISPPPGIATAGRGERHSSGTAGTRRASGSAQPPASGGVPLSGTAGTETPHSKKNRGTKRITQKATQAQMTGGARQEKTDRRRKGGPNIG